ncbi:glycosyltransferase family 9 protein, partial [candidate division NPL-UPA2 bacterium]|nr:glycosyltransferase family 9 protein [candidate division NPL-UPA2 bacterium]
IRVPYEKPEKKHLVEIFAELAQAMELDHYKTDLELWISERERRKVKNLFEKERVGDKDIKVVIHPGASWEEKRWPIEGFAQIADRLVKSYEARVFIIGGSSDVQLANEMIDLMKMKAINCVGRFDIKESAALTEVAGLFIGNDSAPVHIAAAVHTPLIALFGPTNMRKTRPLGDNSIVVGKDIECSPCFHKVYPARCPKGEPVCMKMITVDDVWRVVKALLNENN